MLGKLLATGARMATTNVVSKATLVTMNVSTRALIFDSMKPLYTITKYNLCAPAEGSLGEGNTAKILQKAREMITEEIKNDINAVLVFNVSGKNYVVDAVQSRPLKIELVDTPPKSDVTLIVDEKTFTKMALGKAKPTNAFMTGKLKVKGNIAVAMKAEKMFKAFKGKIDLKLD